MVFSNDRRKSEFNESEFVMLNVEQLIDVLTEKVREAPGGKLEKRLLRGSLQLLDATSHDIDTAIELAVDRGLVEDLGDEFYYVDPRTAARREILVADLAKTDPDVVQKLTEHYRAEGDSAEEKD